MNDDLRQTIIQTSLIAVIGLQTFCIAVANSYNRAAIHMEMDQIIGRGNRASVVIHRLDGDEAHIFSIAVECGAVGNEPDRHRNARGFNFLLEYFLSLLIALG